MDCDVLNPAKGKDAGMYQIFFRIIDIVKSLGNGNFEDVLDGRVDVELKKAIPVEGQDYTLPTGKKGLVHNGTEQALLNDSNMFPTNTVGAKFMYKIGR